MDEEEEYEYEYEPHSGDPKTFEVYGEKSKLKEQIEDLENQKQGRSGFRQNRIQQKIDKLKSQLDSSDQITYF